MDPAEDLAAQKSSYYTRESESVVPTPTASTTTPGNLREMQIIRPYLDLLNQIL